LKKNFKFKNGGNIEKWAFCPFFIVKILSFVKQAKNQKAIFLSIYTLYK